MKCWYCDGTEGDIQPYAMVETPMRHAFDIHPECVERIGAGAELVPLVIPPSVGDV